MAQVHGAIGEENPGLWSHKWESRGAVVAGTGENTEEETQAMGAAASTKLPSDFYVCPSVCADDHPRQNCVLLLCTAPGTLDAWAWLRPYCSHTLAAILLCGVEKPSVKGTVCFPWTLFPRHYLLRGDSQLSTCYLSLLPALAVCIGENRHRGCSAPRE